MVAGVAFAATPVTTPLTTVAIASLLLVQVIVLSEALSGVTVAVNVKFVPAQMVLAEIASSPSFNVTPVVGT